MKTSACAQNKTWAVLCAFVFAVGSAAAVTWANPELVAKVASGELSEAKVSWWGYDAADATEYLQAALSSKAKKVTIDAPTGTWYTRPLRGRSNLELVIPKGVTLMAKRGEYRRQSDTLLTFRLADNVKLTGGGELKMWFEDYTNKALYAWSEWRHELALLSSSHVTVENLTLSDSGGDGIYLGNANGNSNADIVLRDLTITRHNRQGISVITADRLLIERCVLADTCGTPPMAGIDFEPNSAGEMLRDIVVRDTVARGNYGCGFDFSVFQLSAESPDISITLENCTSVGNRQPTKFSKPSDTINGFRGCVTFRNCTFDDGERSCVNLKSSSASETMALKVENCRARDYAKGGELVPMTGAWGWSSVPKPTWPDGAPIRMLSTSAEMLTTAKVFDGKPGEAVRLAAPAIRGHGDFFIYAAQKGRVHLKGKVMPVGRAPFKDAALFVNTMKGRRLMRVEGPTGLRQEADCSFDVPAPGFYHIEVRVGGFHGFTFTETGVPIALGPYGKAKFPGLNCGGGTLYLRVPEGASRLAVAATGGGGMELVHAQVYDGKGVCVLDRDNCSSEVYFSSGTPAPGIWRLEASRPSKGCLDDYAFGTYGHPCHLFLSPEKTWEIPVASNAGSSASGSAALEVGRDVVVVGAGDDQTSEYSKEFELMPETCYAYTCRIRCEGTEGVAVTGPRGLSMYLTPRLQGLTLTNVWQTPSGTKPIRQSFAFGQWHMKGRVVYEQASIIPVTPSFARFGDLELGYGERIDGRRYTLDMPFKSAAKNHGRVPVRLTKTTAGGKGWQLGTGGAVEVTHAFAGRKLRQARIAALVDPCSQGSELVFEASADGGASWTALASCATVTCVRAEIPASLLPAADLRVRVRAASAKCWAAVNRYAFDATLDGAPAFGFGATTYTDAQGQVVMALKPWEYLSEITGEQLPSGNGLSLWRESTGRKVFRGRPPPVAKAGVFRLAAARNEAEAAQLVVRAERDLADVRIAATDLTKGKVRLAADVVNVGRVGYLPIDFTMDTMGACGQWPDPIFDQDAAAFPVKAGENQPFWIRVKPPKGAEAGVYRGKLMVECTQGAGKSTREVPFEVEVYDFDFPDEITCQTAFGLGVRKFIYPYHRLAEKADREAVVRKYLKMLGEHHISPYDPTPTTVTPTWNVKWTQAENPAAAEPIFDWADWDAAMEKVFAEHHFNTFRINVQGLGSCDVTQSRPAKFCGRPYEDPVYQARMQKYLAGIERHLAEKGWLGKAYVYSFDEPLKKDYGLVMQGLGTVKKYAPGLRRMLTTGPQDALMPDGANLWNPLTYVDLKSPAALKARAAGDDFWWYITFSSQAPLVNEHVEHSGVDMRLWGWQTWDADVHGVLIWELAYWNGFRTLPAGTLQNPYEDAMCWTRIWHPWNSGEGRYIYPPKKCFDGGKEPVLEGPVDSIRFEMLREGLEDYEYFVLLKKLDPANPLLKVPAAVQRHVRDYSTDPRHMEAHREKLAREIMRLR